MRQQNTSRLSGGLESRCQVHLIADNGVIHPVPTTKIPNRTESSGYPNPDSERSQQSSVSPFLLQLTHTSLHGYRHFDASLCVLAYTLGCWIAKEQEHRITNKLVDRRAVLKRNR